MRTARRNLPSRTQPPTVDPPCPDEALCARIHQAFDFNNPARGVRKVGFFGFLPLYVMALFFAFHAPGAAGKKRLAL